MKYTDIHLLSYQNKQSVHRLVQLGVKLFMNNPVVKYEIRLLQNNKMLIFPHIMLLDIISLLSWNAPQRVLKHGQ